MIQDILKLDRKIFYIINQTFSNSILDSILPWLRVMEFWIPLYLFLIIFVLVNFDNYLMALLWIAMVILIIAITDVVSSHIIKENIYRLRPCRDNSLPFQVNLLAAYCGGNSSFISSHASNHFAMSIFFSETLKKFSHFFRWIFYVWALIICFAQIYVGVHFPIDILGGIFVGSCIALLCLKLYKYIKIEVLASLTHK